MSTGANKFCNISLNVDRSFKEPLKPKAFQTHAAAFPCAAAVLAPDIFDFFAFVDFLSLFSTVPVLDSFLPPFVSFKLLASS